MSSIELTNIQKYYGDNHILKGFDLTVEDGEFVFFLAPVAVVNDLLENCIPGLKIKALGLLNLAKMLFPTLKKIYL